MYPSKLDLPFEVLSLEEANNPLFKTYDKNSILPLLHNFFGLKSSVEFEFYEVNRPGYGIEHSIVVLSSPNLETFTIRVYEKPNENNDEVGFNLALYKRERIQTLVSVLRDHYPATYFLENKELLVILQRFMWYPVCQFIKTEELKELLEIIKLATSASILLDYNENHWLISDNCNLYYTDTDYMGSGPLKDPNKALMDNINQSMIFLNTQNCRLLTDAFNLLITRDPANKNFVRDFVIALDYFVNSWTDKEEVSDLIKAKIECLKCVVRSTNV
ncbi:MAG: hypothetical protein ACTSW1_18795 [Candidatus Hodarchaeales archaeon]